MYKIIKPGSFEPESHWYPKALNATINPMVSFFLNMNKVSIIERYCHLHPMVDANSLRDVLSRRPKHFQWAGADLINVTSSDGRRQMVVIENNSCPSGQKSMPLLDDHDEFGGYRKLIGETFLPYMKKQRLINGAYAVLYDKNPMEALGYARTLAELLEREVYYIHFPDSGYDSYLQFDDHVLYLTREDGSRVPISAAFRYVTQKPWNRIPIHSKTKFFNPAVACLAGGRNKMIAAKAYDIFNAELQDSQLRIRTPETIWDVSKNEIPIWVKKLGGHAVIKVPYSNAGQGVNTIVNEQELEAFMTMEFEYDQFIVQSLIGNNSWSSMSSQGKLYHVGTIPTKKGLTYVHDLRMMVHATEDGIRPLCVYARRAKEPLAKEVDNGTTSWDMLGTNLSFRSQTGAWDSDTTRLLLMDRRDFNKLGVGLDDLIEAYIQTVLSMTAIDNMAKTLFNSNNKFRMKLFKSFNNDQALVDEIMVQSN